jgi:hypothetical protein
MEFDEILGLSSEIRLTFAGGTTMIFLKLYKLMIG